MQRKGGIAAPSGYAPRDVEPQTRDCIRCSTRRVSCDLVRPRCARCVNDKLPTCSYEWNLGAIVALFPPEYNKDNAITLRSTESYAEEGGYGKVYRTSLKGHDTDVAVKVLLRRKKTTERIMLLALREALTWSELRHERIVPLIGVADYSKICEGAIPQLCLVSPWMQAGNVMEYLAENPDADRKTIMLDIADAVCYLHARSQVVIHGDIRGSNILIDIREGRPRASLTDFGLSFIVEESTVGTTPHSTSTGRSGHPRWLAPERLFPENYKLSPYTSKSEASDVFEMCRAFLEILSGQQPFFGLNDYRVAQLVGEGKHPDRPLLGIQDLTDLMWHTLQRGWAQDPRDRPSATEMRCITVCEMMAYNEGSDTILASLVFKALPMSSMTRKSTGHSGSPNLISMLGIIQAPFRTPFDATFNEEGVIAVLPLISHIFLTKTDIPVLRSSRDLLKDVELKVGTRAPADWRSRHVNLYLDHERGLVKGLFHLLDFLRKSDNELYTTIRHRLESLLCNYDIGPMCREWILSSGRLAAIIADFEAYASLSFPGQDYQGLALINAMTTSGELEKFRDSFIEAGLLQALSRSFETGTPLVWDVLIAWKTLLDRYLRLTKDDEARQSVLLNEQKLGWGSLAMEGKGVIVEHKEYDTVLQAASRKGDATIVRLLLESGADSKATDWTGRTALHFASEAGNVTAMRLLLEGGAEVNTRTRDYRRTALHVACEAGHEPVVRLLVESGGNVNAEARDSVTALHLASGAGHVTIVRLLLEAGAGVNTRYQSPRGTALHFASEAGHETVVRLLLESGADVNGRQLESLRTALHLASKAGHEKTVRLLIQSGAHLNAQSNVSRRTALQLASEAGHEMVVRLLIERGADVHVCSSQFETALGMARQHGHKQVAQILLQNGAEEEDNRDEDGDRGNRSIAQ